MDTSNPLMDLVNRAGQLTAQLESIEPLPRVDRNFDQLLEAGEQLWQRTTASHQDEHGLNNPPDVRASILLGSKGYDVQKVSQQLDSLSSATKKSVPIDSDLQGTGALLVGGNIQGFLERERENAIVNILDVVRKNTIKRVDENNWKNIQRDWEQEKLRILNSLGSMPMDDSSFLPLDAGEKSIFNSSAGGHKIRSLLEPSFIDPKLITNMDPIESTYTRQVEQYVDLLVNGSTQFNLVERFSSAISQEVAIEQSALDMWEIIEFITRDLPLPVGLDSVSHRSKPDVQMIMINNARRYLELKHMQFMESQIYGTPRSGTISDSSAIFTLIKSYLSSKMPSWMGMTYDPNTSRSVPTQLGSMEDGTIEGHPVWCFIWNALRAGSFDAAIDAASRSKSSVLNTEFVSVLREAKQSKDHRLSPKTENHLRLLYRRSLRLSTDPYKKAVYSVLCSTDIAECHSDVIERHEDFLWMKLCQVRVLDGDSLNDSISSNTSFNLSGAGSVTDRISYGGLQVKICDELGEGHFNCKEKPVVYMKLLLLSGQFESAIEFCWRNERLRPHAVHVAIALYEMGLLILPAQHINASLLSKVPSDSQGIKRLNFSRLIMMYASRFEVRHTIDSLNYYYLLRNVKDLGSQSDSNLFLSNVSRLVRETEKFEEILGSMGLDGTRIPGAADKFCGNVMSVIERVASDCEASGQVEYSIQLYDMSGNEERALELLNKQLANVAADRQGSCEKREVIERIALSLASRYHTVKSRLPSGLSSTFFLLVDLMSFFDLYHSRQIADALSVIEKLSVLPLREVEVELRVKEFNQFSEEVRKNIPEILLATMNLIYEQYKQMRANTPSNKVSSSENSTRDQLVGDLKRRAKCLVKYAGMIRFRIPADYNAQLVHLEVMIS